MALSAAAPSDRYEMVEEIGRGAMGTVYLAQDGLIGRLVAIKRLNVGAGLDGPRLNELRQAAISEARAAGILSHPNVVTIHDVVESHDDGLPLIAMEYVHGTNLREMLKAGRSLPRDFVLSVVPQVASALDYAHEMGVVHGDIKPANILITDDEQVKLTDFGIARLKNAKKKGSKRFLGTPKYVSPEQVLNEEVDHRADIFALGVVVFEMLYGRPPFDGETTAEILQRVAYEPFELPLDSACEPAPELVEFLEKALNKDPRLRHQRAADLAADLRRVLSPGDATNDSADTQDLSGHLPEPKPQVEMISRLAKRVDDVRRWTAARVSLRRVLAACFALSMAIPCWFGTSLLLIVGFRTVESPVSRAEHRQRLEAFPLLKEGVELLRQGQPAVAEEILEVAEQVAPFIAATSRLRQRAAREAAELAAYLQREDEIQTLLAAARDALASGRPAEAQRAADSALDLDPERVEARLLLARAERRRTQLRRAAAPPKTRIAEGSLPDPVEATPQAAPPPVTTPKPKPDPSLPATLRIDFFSYLSKGVLTIYSGKDQILLQPFRFVKKSGLLRRKGTSGRLEHDIQLSPGKTTLRIFVAAPKHETQTTTIPVTLEGGSTRVLRIAVSESGETSVDVS